MSALSATILVEKNNDVTGSDLTKNAIIEGLEKKGCRFFEGHSEKHISNDMTVVYGTAIPENNPEYQQAKGFGCPIIHRSELLRDLVAGSESLAVTGTHGKTTTSSLLATVLLDAGVDPSFAIGGMLRKETPVNGKSGKGNYFVLEADESDRSFLRYHPSGAIVTNIEEEHMEHYNHSRKMLDDSFAQFMAQVKNGNALFYSADDPILRVLAKGRVALTAFLLMPM